MIITYIYVQSTSLHSTHGGPLWPVNTNSQACPLSVSGIWFFFHKVLYYDLICMSNKTNLENRFIGDNIYYDCRESLINCTGWNSFMLVLNTINNAIVTHYNGW